MSPWGFAAIVVAALLVGIVVMSHRCDLQEMTIVAGFAGSIVTGTFGLMTAGRRRTSRADDPPPKA